MAERRRDVDAVGLAVGVIAGFYATDRLARLPWTIEFMRRWPLLVGILRGHQVGFGLTIDKGGLLLGRGGEVREISVTPWCGDRLGDDPGDMDPLDWLAYLAADAIRRADAPGLFQPLGDETPLLSGEG